MNNIRPCRNKFKRSRPKGDIYFRGRYWNFLMWEYLTRQNRHERLP